MFVVMENKSGNEHIMAGVNIRVILATEYFAERFFAVLAVTSDPCVGDNVNVGVR